MLPSKITRCMAADALLLLCYMCVFKGFHWNFRVIHGVSSRMLLACLQYSAVTNLRAMPSTSGDEGCRRSIGVPSGQFSGLWKQHTYSDMVVRLTSSQPTEEASSSHESIAAGKVHKEIPAHKAVLMAGSSYFKGLLTTGEDMAAGSPGCRRDLGAATFLGSRFIKAIFGSNTQHHKDERDSTPAHDGRGTYVVDMPCDSKEDADAIEAVLEFLYNHKLPASTTVSMLAKMFKVADYLGADLCVKACATRLSECHVSKETMLQVCDSMDVLQGCSDLNSDITAKLQAALRECLLEVYGDVLVVVNSEDKLSSFCKLPLSSIELWGKSDKLVVDSENTVVVLLNKWWRNQCPACQTLECKEKLSGLVRVVFLSHGYLQYALDKLDWFIAPFPEYKLACTMFKTFGSDFGMLGLTGSLDLTKRQRTSQPHLKMFLRFSLEQIREAVRSSSAEWRVNGPEGYWHGYIWSVGLKGCSLEDNTETTVLVSVEVTLKTANAMPEGIPATAKVAVPEEPFMIIESKHEMFYDGQSRTATKSFQEQNVVAALKKYLTADKHMVLTVTISDVH